MPDQYRQAFAALGANIADHVELRRVEPAAYRVFFGGGGGGGSHVDMLNDASAFAEQLDAIEPGAGAKLL